MKNIEKSFAQYLRTIGYSRNSQNMILHSLKEFTSQNPNEITQITKDQIRTYHNYLSTRPNLKRPGGLSSSMLRQYLYGLKVFFGWLEQTEKIQNSPMSGYKLPEVEHQQRTILMQKEIKELYEVCSTYKDRSILGLFYGCGLRRSEGEKLNAKDIHFRESLLYVRKGKGGKRRVIPISKEIRTDFIKYHKTERGYYPEQAAFIINESGTRMKGSSYNTRLKQLLEKTGIKKQITLHNLRHSIATHLLIKGLSLEQVRDFLGHAHLETTQIYTHYDTQKLPP